MSHYAPNTKHSDCCTMVFGKPSKHDNCPRCQELKAGAAPREGWAIKTNAGTRSLNAYCFSVPIYYSHCTPQTSPSCACGKMSFTD